MFFKKPVKPTRFATVGNTILTGALLQVGMSLAAGLGDIVAGVIERRRDSRALAAEAAPAPAPYAQPRAEG